MARLQLLSESRCKIDQSGLILPQTVCYNPNRMTTTSHNLPSFPISSQCKAISASISRNIYANYLDNTFEKSAQSFYTIKQTAIDLFQSLPHIDALIQLRELFPNNVELLAKVLDHLKQKGIISWSNLLSNGWRNIFQPIASCLNSFPSQLFNLWPWLSICVTKHTS